MKNAKNVKIFTHIVGNLVMFVVLFVCFVFGFVVTKNQVAEASNSEYKGTIYAGDKTSKNVSLMINVYWGTEYIENILEILNSHDVKTTFFVGGTWAKDNPELLKKIYQAGHEIGSHGYSHKEHGKLSMSGNITEITMCHDIVKKTLGIDMKLFAPPGGSYNVYTTESAKNLGYKTIMWTRDTIDWRDHDTNLIYNRAVTNMCGGDLILMHPTANTVEALSNIIEYAKGHELTVVPVSTTLGLA